MTAKESLQRAIRRAVTRYRPHFPQNGFSNTIVGKCESILAAAAAESNNADVDWREKTGARLLHLAERVE